MRTLTDEEIRELGGNPEKFKKTYVYWGEEHLNQHFFNEVSNALNEEEILDYRFNIGLVGRRLEELSEKVEKQLHSTDLSSFNEFFDETFDDVLREDGLEIEVEKETNTLIVGLYKLKEVDVKAADTYNLKIKDTYAQYE